MTKTMNTIFMLGIGGAGMQSLAQLLAARGHTIVGCDYDITKTRIPALSAFTIVPEAEAPELLATADRLIYTDAAPPDHPLRVFARQHRIPEQMLFEATGEFSQDFTTIAVTGTHGKSSTTAFLGHILAENNLDPTVQLGAHVGSWPLGNARAGRGKYFVVEADEYRRHFLSLHPAHIIVTAIDFDHPDFFTSLEDVLAAYASFLRQLTPGGIVVCPAALMKQYPSLPWPATTITVTAPPQRTPLPIPGTHMQSNAALAVAMAAHLGVRTAQAWDTLRTFPGLARRFERIGTVGPMDVISDYGHHPTEIAATLAAAREWYPGKRILAIVEPHMAARVRAFLPLFIQALTTHNADAVIVFPTFYVTGRDDAVEAQASTQHFLKTLRRQRDRVFAADSATALATLMREKAGNFDIAIAFTAGVLDTHLRKIVGAL